MKNAEKELVTANETKAKLVAERDKCVSQAREFLTKQDEAQALIDELKSKKSELKKSLEAFHGQEHKLKMDEITQKNALKEHDAVEAEKRSYIRDFTHKIGKLKLNRVENDSTDIPALSKEEIERLSLKRLLSDMELLRVQKEDIKPNLSAIEEYKKKEKLCDEKQKDLDEITLERNLHSMRFEELKKRRLREFMKGFTAIAKKLKEIYQMLTLGGDAEMELVDTFDPFSKGIDFSVRPPRKSWKFMRNLSGGEKTLSSLALVFALHYYRPTPFYVMDEIDAALDVRNVAIVGFFLKERQKNTQFVIVSLRNIMNELADHLIGIYKTGNTSKNVSIMGTSKWKEEDQAAMQMP